MRPLALAWFTLLLTLAPAVAQSLEEPVRETPPPRIWGRVDYLLWWIKGDELPLPLVTTGPAGDPQRGSLASPSTQVIFGDDALDYPYKSGGRFLLGGWLGGDRLIGLEMGGFGLETHTIHGAADADRVTGQPVIARPFINAQTGQQDAFIVTAPTPPDFATGGIDVFGDSRLWGGEVNALLSYIEDADLRVRLLAGFRYLGLKDDLQISGGIEQRSFNQITFLGQPIADPAALGFNDEYQTHNHFYGGQVGGQIGWRRGRLTFDAAAKFALGCTHQELNIQGETVLTVDPINPAVPPTVQVAPGGLYAQPSNIGFSERNQFAFATELDLRLGLELRRWLGVEVGYTFLYWSDVVRPGAALNPVIDPRQVPGRPEYDAAATSANPTRLFPSDGFWAQGLSAGLRIQY